MLHSPIPIIQSRHQSRTSRNYGTKWRSGCGSGGGSSASSMTPTSAASSMYTNWLGEDTYSLHFLIHYAIPPGLTSIDLKMYFVCEELYEHEMKQIGDWWSLKISVNRSLDIKSLHYTYELRDITSDDADVHSTATQYNYQQQHSYHHHHHHHPPHAHSGHGHGINNISSGSESGGSKGRYDFLPSTLAQGSNIDADETGERSSFGASSKIKGEFSVSSLETTASELISRIKEQARPRSNVMDCEFKAGGCRSSARELYLEELPHDCTVIEVRDRWITGDNGEDSYLRTDFFSTLFSTPHSSSPGFDHLSVPVSSSTAIPDDLESPKYGNRSQNSAFNSMYRKSGMEYSHGKVTFVNSTDEENALPTNTTSPTSSGTMPDMSIPSPITNNDNIISTNNDNNDNNDNNNGDNDGDDNSYNDGIGGGIPCAVSGTEIIYDEDDDDDNSDIEVSDNDEDDDEDNDDTTTTKTISISRKNSIKMPGDGRGSGRRSDYIGERDAVGGEARSSSIPAARAFRRRRFLVTFKVLCTCLDKEEEEVRVSGGLLSLGCWNAETALPMTCDDYPVWTATLDLSTACFDDVSPDDKNFSFEYKYLIAPKHKSPQRANPGDSSTSSYSPAESPAVSPQGGNGNTTTTTTTTSTSEQSTGTGMPGRILWEACDNRRFASVVDGMWNVAGSADCAHDVTITLNDSPFEQQPWRGVGLSVNLASLRSNKNLGLGEFPDIKQLVDWAAPAGFSYIQLTPLNDLADTQDPLCANPNAPISAFAFNPVFLRLDDVSGTPEANTEIERLKARCRRAQALMSYKEIINAKMLILTLIYDSRASFVRSDPEYSAFLDANRAWLEPYARYKIKHWTPLRRHTASSAGSSASASSAVSPATAAQGSSSAASSAGAAGGPSSSASASSGNVPSALGGNVSGGSAAGGAGGSGVGVGGSSGVGAAGMGGLDGAGGSVGGGAGNVRGTTVGAPPEEFFYMVQWFLHTQLLEASQYASSKKIALHIEMPFFVHPDGVDYHENPSLFYPTTGPDGIYASRLPSESGTALTGGSYSFITPQSLLPTTTTSNTTTTTTTSATTTAATATTTTSATGGSSATNSSSSSSTSSSSSGPSGQVSSGPQSMQTAPPTSSSTSSAPSVIQSGQSSTGMAQGPGPSTSPAGPSGASGTTSGATSASSASSASAGGKAGVPGAGGPTIISMINAGAPVGTEKGRPALLTMLAGSSSIKYPVPRWEAHQDQEYQWYGMRLEHLSQYFQGVCLKDVLNYFRIWTVPSYTDDPMYGAFVPHVPVEPFEVELAGIKHVDNFCRPFFTRQAAAALFGADANKALEIIADCVGEGGGGYYTLKPELVRPGSPAEKALPQSYGRALRKLRRYYTLFRREEDAPKKRKRSKDPAKGTAANTTSNSSAGPNLDGTASGNDSDNGSVGGGGSSSYGSANFGSSEADDATLFEHRNAFGLFGNGRFGKGSASCGCGCGGGSSNSSRGLIPLPVFTEPWCPVLDDLDRNARETLQSIHREYYFGSRSTVLWENTGRTVLEQIASSTQMLVTAEAADLRLVPEWCRLGLAASGIALHAPLWVHETAVRNTPVLSVAATSSLSFAPLIEWWKECRNERFKRSIYRDRLWMDGSLPAQCTDAAVRRAVERTLESNSLLALLPLQDVLALKKELAEVQRATPDLIAQEDFRYRTPVTIDELLENGSFICFIRALFEQAGRSCSYKNAGKCFPTQVSPSATGNNSSNGSGNNAGGSSNGSAQQIPVMVTPKKPSAVAAAAAAAAGIGIGSTTSPIPTTLPSTMSSVNSSII